MQQLLDFLKTDFTVLTESLKSLPPLVGKNELLNNLNKALKSESFKAVNIQHNFKESTFIERGQIWLVKSNYVDYLGNEQRSDHPILIRIVSAVEEIGEEKFVRIQVVSPFIEFVADDDLMCDDVSIIGFPFIIETWNEQPMLIELLDQYISTYVINPKPLHKDIILSKEQTEFRKVEVTRAQYLNHSISSLLLFLENQQAVDGGVVISLFEKTTFPKLFINEIQANENVLLAAKTSIDKEDKFLKYKEADLPFELLIRKNDEGYIITVIPAHNLQLLDQEAKEIKGEANSERNVFSKLQPGLYQLKTEELSDPIKIRLK